MKQSSPREKFKFDVMDLSKNPESFKQEDGRLKHVKDVLLPTAVKKMFTKDTWKEKKL